MIQLIIDDHRVIPPLAQLVRAQSLYLCGPWFESKRADPRKTTALFQSQTKVDRFQGVKFAYFGCR